MQIFHQCFVCEIIFHRSLYEPNSTIKVPIPPSQQANTIPSQHRYRQNKWSFIYSENKTNKIKKNCNSFKRQSSTPTKARVLSNPKNTKIPQTTNHKVLICIFPEIYKSLCRWCCPSRSATNTGRRTGGDICQRSSGYLKLYEIRHKSLMTTNKAIFYRCPNLKPIFRY